jgi:hypothetical protein
MRRYRDALLIYGFVVQGINPLATFKASLCDA